MHEIIAHTPKKVVVFMTFLKAKDVRVGTASALTITFFLIWTWERSFDPHNSCYNTSHSPYYSPNCSLKGGHRVISGMRPRSLIQSKSHAFDSRIQKNLYWMQTHFLEADQTYSKKGPGWISKVKTMGR